MADNVRGTLYTVHTKAVACNKCATIYNRFHLTWLRYLNQLF